MPFCSQCGNQVQNADVFCAKCGSRQPVTPAQPPASDPLKNMQPHTAALLCYIPVVGWIAAIIVLASSKFRANRSVRFHAFQGLYLFVTWLVVHEFIGKTLGEFYGPFDRIDHLFELILLGLWVFMIVKSREEPPFALPVLGELAEKSLTER